MNKKLFLKFGALILCMLFALAGFAACQTETEYKITLPIGLTGGVVVCDKEIVTSKDTATIEAQPSDGYSLDWLKINGEAVETTGNKYVLKNVDKDVSVTAAFKLVEYDVTIIASSNGTVTASSTGANEGDIVTLTITPDRGYKLSRVSIGKGSGGSVTFNSAANTFVMPGEAVSVTATFVENRLSAPTVSFDTESMLLTWTEVANATGYKLYLDGGEAISFTTAQTREYDLSSMSGIISVEVVALGNYSASGNYMDSLAGETMADNRQPVEMTGDITTSTNHSTKKLTFTWTAALGAQDYKVRINSVSENAWVEIGNVTSYDYSYPAKAETTSFEIIPIGDEDHRDGTIYSKSFTFASPEPTSFDGTGRFITVAGDAGTTESFTLGGSGLPLPVIDTSSVDLNNSMTMSIIKEKLTGQAEDVVSKEVLHENVAVENKTFDISAGNYYQIKYKFTNNYGFLVEKSQTIFVFNSDMTHINEFYPDVSVNTSAAAFTGDTASVLNMVNASVLSNNLGEGKLVHATQGFAYEPAGLVAAKVNEGIVSFPSYKMPVSGATLTKLGFILYNDSDTDAIVMFATKAGTNWQWIPYATGDQADRAAPVIKAKSFAYYDAGDFYGLGIINPTTGLLNGFAFDVRSRGVDSKLSFYISMPIFNANAEVKLPSPVLTKQADGKTVTWESVAGASAYKLSLDSGVTWTDCPEKTYTYDGTEYITIKVKAVNAKAESDAASYTIDLRQKLATPVNVTVADNNTDGYTFSWDAVTDTSGYEYRFFKNGAWTAWTATNATSNKLLYADLNSASSILKIEVYATAGAGFADSEIAVSNDLTLTLPQFLTFPSDMRITGMDIPAGHFFVYLGDSSKKYNTPLPTYAEGTLTHSALMLGIAATLSGGAGNLWAGNPPVMDGTNGYRLYESFGLEITYKLTSPKGVVLERKQFIAATHLATPVYNAVSLFDEYYPDEFDTAVVSNYLTILSSGDLYDTAKGLLGNNIMRISAEDAGQIGGSLKKNVFVGEQGKSNLTSVMVFLYNNSDVDIDYTFDSGVWGTIKAKSYGYHYRGMQYSPYQLGLIDSKGYLSDFSILVKASDGSTADLDLLVGDILVNGDLVITPPAV